MRYGVLISVSILLSCAHAEPRWWEHPQEGQWSTCERTPTSFCGIGMLPRIDEGDWAPGELRSFLTSVPKGTAAVAHRDGKVRLVPGCRLRGRYLEVAGKAGRGRFWSASAGALFIPQEVDPPCVGATHVIAVFATREEQFGAILIPLPCPSVTDPQAAAGCIGQGLNGPERLSRASTLKEFLEQQDPRMRAPDLGLLLQVYALAPDGIGFDYLFRATGGDCAFRVHATYARDRLEEWKALPSAPRRHLPDSSYPGLDERIASENCGYGPPFLTCFPGLFDPAPGSGPGCWTAANPSGYP
jgi:hypothetical protein